MPLSEKKRKYLLIIFLGSTLFITSMSVYFYQLFFAKNILVKGEETEVFIRPDMNFEQLLEQLRATRVVNDGLSFAFVARVMSYQERVKPGRYVLQPDMNNVDAIRILRSQQSPVAVTFNTVRTKRDLARKLTRNLYMDSTAMLAALNNPATVQQYGFDTTTVMCMFLPDTYEFYWTASAEDIFGRMKKNYDRFWNQSRRDKAQALGFTPVQVSILAAIVEAESKIAKEQPTIAGVYINRLNTNMPLQADPTVIFALGDFSIRRVLHGHLDYDSPYNTYKYTGLPPGPITLPSASAIDAVLNYEKHNYLFFCAKEDFSGAHVFAETLPEHSRNARRYQEALNKRNIK